MFRVNSTSKQIVRLNVISAGIPQLVDLLPKNFVFTDAVTDQMKLLEKDGVIRVREAKVQRGGAAQVAKAEPAIQTMEGKLDFVADDAKVAKVQKKKK